MENTNYGQDIEKLESENERLRDVIEIQQGWISLISHNFKQIFSNWVLLLDTREEGLISDEEILELLPSIRQDARQNLQLIEEAGIWSRTQRKEFQPSPVRIFIMELYAEIKDTFQDQMSAKGLELVYSGKVDASLTADRFLITQVLERIVDNALKYSHPDGLIHFRVDEKDESTSISVVDQGVGMKKAHIDSIFSFDTPIHHGTMGEIGLGLGLKIVQNFVDLMGGEIDIESSENIGTSVCIRIPDHKKGLSI